MKKLLSLALAVLMLLPLIVGCAQTPPTETNVPATDAPETDAPETDAPETDTPETDAPETDVPETDAPETDAPVPDIYDLPEKNNTILIVAISAAVVLIGIAVGIICAKKKK